MYEKKVEEGEIDKKKVNGFGGRGWEFSRQEDEKVKNDAKERYKASLQVEDEVEEVDTGPKDPKQLEEERKKKEEKQLLDLMYKDPTA